MLRQGRSRKTSSFSASRRILEQEMKINKNLLLLLVILASVFAFLYLTKPMQEASPKQVETQQEIQSATIIANFGDTNMLSKEFNVNDETTAYSLLQELVQSESLDLETQQYDFGIFVKAINGYESSAEKAWIYYVNGESGQVTADQKKINSNDLVEWKYIEPDE